MPTLLSRGATPFGSFGSHGNSGFGPLPFAAPPSSSAKGRSNWWDIINGWLHDHGWPGPGTGFPGGRPPSTRPGGSKGGHPSIPGAGNGNHGGGGSGSGAGNGNGGGGGNGGGSGGGGSGNSGGGGSGSGGSENGGGGSGNGGGGSGNGGGSSGNGGGNPTKGGGGANNSGGDPHSGKPDNSSQTTPPTTRNPSSTSPPDQSDHSSTEEPFPPNSSPTKPGSTLTIPVTTSNTATSIPTLPSSQVSATKHLNVAAVVAPIITVLLLICALVLWFYYRRRRNAQPQPQQIGSTSDLSSLPPSRERMPFFANIGGMILPPRTQAARMRGGAAPLPMQEDATQSRPVSFASSAFAFQNPFSARAAAMASTTTLETSSGFGDEHSVAVALGHSGASDVATIPDGAAPPMQYRTLGATPLYAHHSHQASTSGSIVGSGMFSLASAHHGHSTGGTPAAVNTADPFADRNSWGGDSATGVPWPALASSDGHDGPSDWRHSRASSGDASMFVPGDDAPPVPPLSPDSPGSAAPLMDRVRFETFGRGQLPMPVAVQTPGGESLYPATTPGTRATRDSYFGVSSGIDEEGSPGASSAEVGEARRASVSAPVLVNAPAAASGRPLTPEP